MTEYIQIMKALCLTGGFIIIGAFAAFVVISIVEISNEKTTRK